MTTFIAFIVSFCVGFVSFFYLSKHKYRKRVLEENKLAQYEQNKILRGDNNGRFKNIWACIHNACINNGYYNRNVHDIY